jgi:hypothetical protein
MAEYDDLARSVEQAGYEIFWLGPVSREQIGRLEALLELSLPESFRRFLECYGGGGIVSAEISGIEDDAANESGGTVFGDTQECRQHFGLPAHLVVIYFHDNEVCWCLDVSRWNGQECPVVSYSLFSRTVDREIAPDFHTFLKQHFALYGQPA